MANLSNINGKFSVSDVGAVTFNNAFTFPTADGAANYVLQTNGSGQLAWALNGNGDISGSGTANTVTRFTGSGTGVKTIGNGPITFSGDNSTFTGDVTIGPKSNASIATSESGGATTKLMSASVGRSGTFSNHEYHLMQNSAVAVTIDVNKNVTFEAPVWIPDYIYHVGDPDTYFGFPTNNEWKVTVGGSTKIFADSNAAYMYYQGGVKLQTTSTGVTVTSAVSATSFLGDLNGTINTVTTATTKGNSTNDTTVATTAFVQNVVGTIPAGLVFQGTWNAATNSPTLTSGSGTTGNFYIVSVAGSTNLDGITDWQVGDWAVFIEQGASDQWEKIDNSSVLGGSGTGGSFAGWSGSGTSVTLGNAPVTFSGNNSTFAGDIYVTGSSNSLVVISRDNMFVDGGQFYIGADDSTTDDSFRQRTASGSYFIESRKSGTWTNRLQINTAGTLIGSQGATFAGNVELKSDAGGATKFLRIWNEGTVDATDDALITWQTQASRTYSMGIHRDSGSLTISNQDASVASGELITIDTSGNSTFAGNVTIDHSTNANSTLKLHAYSSAIGDAFAWNLTAENSANGYAFRILQGTSPVFTIANTASGATLGTATFAGNVGVAGKTPTFGLNLAQGTSAGSKIAWTDGTPNFAASIYANSSTDKLTFATKNASNVETIALTIDTSQNSTFAGSVTATSFSSSAGATFNPMATIEYSDISTGENRGLRIINTSGTDQQWNITAGVTGSENESFCIRDATANVNALTMAASSGNATFAGNVKLLGVLELNDVAQSIDFLQSGAINFDSNNDQTGRVLTIGSGRTGDSGGTTNVIFNEDGNSIFTGNVGIGSTGPSNLLTLAGSTNSYSTAPLIRFDSTSTAHVNIRNWAIGPADSSYGNFHIYKSAATGGNPVTGTGATTFTIDYNGNVGIGTASPGEKLDVVGSGGNTNIRVYDASANSEVGIKLQGDAKTWTLQNWGSGGDKLRVLDNSGNSVQTWDNNGNVGIGTVDPDITGFGWNCLTVVGGTTAGSAGVLELGSPTTNANNQNLGIIAFMDGSTRNAQIDVSRATSTSTSNMSFYTNAGSGIAERMRITSAGNVGIGTTSPTESKLVISGGTTGSVGGGDAGITMINKFDNPDNSWSILPVITGVSNTGFSIRDNTDSADRLVIDGSGNVGIGTATPGGNLEIKTLSGGSGVNTLRLNTNFSGGNTVDINPFITGANNGGMEIKLAGSQKLVMLPSGNVGIGNTSPQTTFHVGTTTTVINQFTNQIAASNFFVNGNANGGASFFQCKTAAVNINMMGNNDFACNQFTFYHKPLSTSQNVVGTIATFSSSTQYNTTSDYRLKENIIPLSDSITRLKQLKPSRFNFIEDPERTMDGFLAHEVQNIVPEAVNGEKDAVDENGNEVHQGIDQAKLVPLLVAAIQEQQKAIDDLKSRIKQLEN